MAVSAMDWLRIACALMAIGFAIATQCCDGEAGFRQVPEQGRPGSRVGAVVITFGNPPDATP